MREMVLRTLKKTGLLAIATALVVGTNAMGVLAFAQPDTALAATCTPQDQYPQTNIIYCGLSGSTASDYMSSFKSYYDANTDGHGNTDLQQVYNAANFSTSMFSTTSGHWTVGTSFPDGTISAEGRTVATNVQIASRCYLANMGNCQPPDKYTHLTSNVYTRDATWFFDKTATSKTTLVHINSNGVADFALWTGCGNVLLFKPTTPPKPQLQCISLTKNAASTLAYTFTATASAQNTTIKTYDFDFGDGNSQHMDVNGITKVTSQTHTYNQTDAQQTITAKVTVGDGSTSVSGANCQVQLIIPPKAKQSLVCQDLTATPQNATKTSYIFTATASQQNTTIDSFIFDFGDSSAQQTVATSSTTASSSAHSYAAGNYTILAWVHGPLGKFGGASPCLVSISVQTPPLVNTGPGSVLGLFAATTTVGGIVHQFVIRRKLVSL